MGTMMRTTMCTLAILALGACGESTPGGTDVARGAVPFAAASTCDRANQ